MIATYVSTTQFTIDGDQTTIFVAGRKIKCNCGADGYKYGTVSASSYSSPDTTVTLTGASDDLTSNLTSVEWGVATPQSLPILDVVDATLSGTPKIFEVKDAAGTSYYFKAYPTKA